jgi:hypothetical protein
LKPVQIWHPQVKHQDVVSASFHRLETGSPGVDDLKRATGAHAAEIQLHDFSNLRVVFGVENADHGASACIRFGPALAKPSEFTILTKAFSTGLSMGVTCLKPAGPRRGDGDEELGLDLVYRDPARLAAVDPDEGERWKCSRRRSHPYERRA